ncbi:MAG: nitroreductase family protein [Lentimicrobiaceae bacterium]|nr:nitroreductase family protein [Lentimicrobiaceae bacterium]MCO5264834.1 nitroreductase family protein [Lentimicrobium sp.]
MSVATSRTGTENARITIDYQKCTACGLCVKVCKDFSLIMDDQKLTINPKPLFGCMACGHCVAVCPHDAISVEGRTVAKEDFSALKQGEPSVNFPQLYSFLLNRRSIRDFKNKPVEHEIIEKILSLSSTAPMGLPPSDVGVMVLNSREKVRQFSFDFVDLLSRMKWMVSPAVMRLMRPFMGKDDYLAFKSFVMPLVEFFCKSKQRQENYVLYDAPLAIMFYGNMSDPADPYITATYATLAAESLGLGACMIGSVGPFLKHTGKDFKRKYGLPSKMRDSIIVVFGYPQFKFNKTIKRSFAKVDYYV